MPTPDAIAAARRLAVMASESIPAEDLATEIQGVMRTQYIRGGISALEAVIDSLPSAVMELPEDQRKLIASMINGMEMLIEKLKAKL